MAAAAPCAGARVTEVARETGVRFLHDKGARGAKRLPETMGSGLAWLDYDYDGWLDLYLVQSGPFPEGTKGGNRLFRNLGNGHFVDVTEAAGAGGHGYGQGVVSGDLDGDGFGDLYVTAFGETLFLRNLGDGRFAEETAERGLGVRGWSSSAALGDVDGDGDLDLYVTRYLRYDPEQEPFCADETTGGRRYCDPSLFLGAPDVLLRNEGSGTFVDVTEDAGLGEATGRGLGVVLVDLDGDFAPEIYVANDLTLNLLFRNRGGGRFEDVSLLSGAAVNGEGKAEAGMGIGVGDLDEDGDPELAITNFDVETNTLYDNRGALYFEDVSAPSGFGPPSFNRLGFGIVFADFDGDRHLDVFVANGHIFENPNRQNDFAQPNQILEGDGSGRFAASPCPPLETKAAVHRGLAAGDYDNDGSADVGVQANGGWFELWKVRSGQRGWVGVRLEGPNENSEAVGAVVSLTDGSKTSMRWVLAGDSYQSSSDRRVLFALPSSPAGPRTLRVTWSDGMRWSLRSPPSDAYLVLRRVAAEG